MEPWGVDSSTKDHREIESLFLTGSNTACFKGSHGDVKEGCEQRDIKRIHALLESVGTVLWGSQARLINSNKKE